MPNTKKSKDIARPSNKFRLKKYLNKKSLLRTGVCLSILLNVVAIVIVLLIISDVHDGRLNYLTDGNLQVETCNNYFSRTNIKNSGSYQVGNVNFVQNYLSAAEQKNKCNSLNNNINFQYLVQADNQNALGYYDQKTNFSIPGIQTQVQIPYDATTHKPIDPQSMGLSY